MLMRLLTIHLQQLPLYKTRTRGRVEVQCDNQAHLSPLFYHQRHLGLLVCLLQPWIMSYMTLVIRFDWSH